MALARTFASVFRKNWSDTYTVSSSTTFFMPTGAALGCPSKDDVENTAVGTFSKRSFTSRDMTAITLPFSRAARAGGCLRKVYSLERTSDRQAAQGTAAAEGTPRAGRGAPRSSEPRGASGGVQAAAPRFMRRKQSQAR